MTRLTTKPINDSSDDELPAVNVLLERVSRGKNKALGGTVPKSSTSEQQSRKIRRLGSTRNRDLSNPLLQKWDTGEHDSSSSLGQIEVDLDKPKPRSRPPSRTLRQKPTTSSADAQQNPQEDQIVMARTRRPRVSPALAESDDDSAHDVLPPQQNPKPVRVPQKSGSRSTSSNLANTKVPDLSSTKVKSQPQPEQQDKEPIAVFEDEDSVYQTAAESVSEDSDDCDSDFTPDDFWNAARRKPSTRVHAQRPQDRADSARREAISSRSRTASESATDKQDKRPLEADLANTFSKLRLQLHEFSDDESDHPPPARPSTPPPTDTRAQPRLLLSPKKQPLIPRTPHKSNTDAFWSSEIVNDWNDKHSPRKPIFAPKLNDSPVKMSPTKQEKKSFMEKRQELAEDFLRKLDRDITQGRISELSASAGGVRLVWSKTLNTTAGRANWRREAIRSKQSSGSGSGEPPAKEYRHHASIELAEKVIDSEDRLLNTLAHEFCHLATFMIDNVTKNPHGSHFQAWGAKCTRAFGRSHGIEVTTKHSYIIDYKYIWQCGDCQLEFKRHSKSIDPARHRCGGCKGVLAQVKPVPRKVKGGAGGVDGGAGGKLTEYQVFMKEQMKLVREENPGTAQKEVMRIVAERWAKKNGKNKSVKGKGSTETAGVNSVTDQLEILTVED